MVSEKNEQIKFSILVPVYQVEQYIEECIQSVLNQTYSNWELILVDDGSKDKSGEICDRYAKADARIRVYHKENRGQLHSRLYGIDRATGDFCIFIDSDDTIKLETLEVVCQTIQKYDCDCVIYGLERVLNGTVIEKSEFEEECFITDKREFYKKICKGIYTPMWRKAVKKSVFQDKDYSQVFHQRLWEDLLHSIEIWEYCDNAAFINNRFYEYRVNPNSVSHTANVNKIMESLNILKETLDYFSEKDSIYERASVDWGTVCLTAICSSVVTIANANESVTNRIKTFEMLKGKPVYQNIVTNKKYDNKKIGLKTKIIFMLFSKGCYHILIFLSMLYRRCIKKD